MLPDGAYTGVVDRFEQDANGMELAVILLEQDDQVVEQVEIPRSTLPTDVEPNAVLAVDMVDGEVDTVEFLPHETETRAQSAQDRFERLAERPPNGPGHESSTDPEE